MVKRMSKDGSTVVFIEPVLAERIRTRAVSQKRTVKGEIHVMLAEKLDELDAEDAARREAGK